MSSSSTSPYITEDSANNLAGLLDPFSGVSESLGNDPSLESAGDSMTQLMDLGNWGMGIGLIIAIVYFLFALAKLSMAADDATARKRAIQGIMVSGIGIAILGSMGFLVPFFYNFIIS